jgi:hypothetical protein
MSIARLFILLWFAVAFTLSITGWFERFSSATLFGFGAIAAATGFTVLHWLSERFRGFLRACDLRILTLGQLFRFYGVLALVKAYQHVLPALFAVPTGVLDVIFAVTSFYVAARLVPSRAHPRPAFIVWHVLGLMALATSAILAMVTPSQSMARFPMSIVPTFVGPLVLVFHLLALVAAAELTKLYCKPSHRVINSGRAHPDRR